MSEFRTVDPMLLKAARRRDRERLEEAEQEVDLDGGWQELEEKIERGLEERRTKVRGPYARAARCSSSSSEGEERRASTSSEEGAGSGEEKEAEDIGRFIHEQTMGVISETLGSPRGVTAA